MGTCFQYPMAVAKVGKSLRIASCNSERLAFVSLCDCEQYALKANKTLRISWEECAFAD